MCCSERNELPGSLKSLHELTRRFSTLAIIGTEKATGKTEVLRKLIRIACARGRRIGVTSLGTEGEQQESTATPQRLAVCEGVLFATLEGLFRSTKTLSELLHLSSFSTAIGKIVVARALASGELMLSGPVSSSQIHEIIKVFRDAGAEQIILDGYAARTTHAVPSIADGIILATGATLSGYIDELVERTLDVICLVSLKEVHESLKQDLVDLEQGVWVIEKGRVKKIEKKTILSLSADYLEEGDIIYSTGAVGESFVRSILDKDLQSGLTIVVRDFTRLFVSSRTLSSFLERGGSVKVIDKATLAAVTVNPVSGTGSVTDSRAFIEALSAKTDIPVIDVCMENSP